jgi:hypothetical protein
MTKSINTYEELMQEKERLKILFKVQKEVIREDINEIKEELAPVKKAISVGSKFFTKESGNVLLNATSNTLIDLVVKKFLLARSGWLMKIVVPFLAKNYSSHVIDDNKDTIIAKIMSFFKRKKDKASSNGTMHHEEHEEEDEY